MSVPNYDSLDDAAAAALWILRNEPAEYIGLLYETAEGFHATSAHSTGSGGHSKGTFPIPAGSLRGLFHNHPDRGGRDIERDRFSDDDIAQARRLGVPSYIEGRTLRRFTPGGPTAGEPVLAQIPIREILRRIGGLLAVPPDEARDEYGGLLRSR